MIPTAEGDINDVLIKTLAEAHANTNLKLEVVHEMFRKPQVNFDYSKKHTEFSHFYQFSFLFFWFGGVAGYVAHIAIQKYEPRRIMARLC